MPLSILRLGHRLFRDQRISSHVFLTARALGATAGYYTGQRDRELETSIQKAVENWGGPFSLSHLTSHKPFLKSFRGKVVHLTAYGLPFQKHLSTLKKQKNLLVVVGGEKVPPDIYQRADWNLSVSSQPLSEVSAIGIFLYEMQKRKFKTQFTHPKLTIVPQKAGKKTISRDGKAQRTPRA